MPAAEAPSRSAAMKLDDTEASKQHLAAILSLAEHLASHSFAVFEHVYHYLQFGSWVLVIGNRHRRVQLVWDGKESLLRCSVSRLSGSSATPDWQSTDCLQISDASDRAVYAVAEELVLRHLGNGRA